MSGHDSFISRPALGSRRRARGANRARRPGPAVIGFDPGPGKGRQQDRHARSGRPGPAPPPPPPPPPPDPPQPRGSRVESRPQADHHGQGGPGGVKQVIDKDRPRRRLHRTVGGVAPASMGPARRDGFGETVGRVNFGSAPFEPPRATRGHGRAVQAARSKPGACRNYGGGSKGVGVRQKPGPGAQSRFRDSLQDDRLRPRVIHMTATHADGASRRSEDICGGSGRAGPRENGTRWALHGSGGRRSRRDGARFSDAGVIGVGNRVAVLLPALQFR